jgi:hypothetical protein
MFRAVKLAVSAAHTFFRIFDDGLFACLIHPDHIHGTAVDTCTAASA